MPRERDTLDEGLYGGGYGGEGMHRTPRSDRGPAFLLPGEDTPRRCGEDPDMPPGPGGTMPQINLGYAHLKRGR